MENNEIQKAFDNYIESVFTNIDKNGVQYKIMRETWFGASISFLHGIVAASEADDHNFMDLCFAELMLFKSGAQDEE